MHASNYIRLGLVASFIATPFDETSKICIMRARRDDGPLNGAWLEGSLG